MQYQTLKGSLCGVISVLFLAVSSVCLKSSLNKFEYFKVPGKHYSYTLLDKHPTYINLKLSSKMFTIVLKHHFCVLSS